MQHYIDQLTGDLLETCQAAEYQKKLMFDDENDQDAETIIQSAENFVFGKTEPMSHITGIDPVLFPPPDRLSEKQKSQLTEVMEHLLLIKNFIPEFPTKLPLHRRYQFLRDMWHEKFAPPITGHVHVEFCKYEPAECPFPEYCDYCNEFDDLSDDIYYQDSEGNNGEDNDPYGNHYPPF